MKWTRQLMYIARNDSGVIVGIQESRPKDYVAAVENASKPPLRKPNTMIEQQIHDYADQKRRRRA